MFGVTVPIGMASTVFLFSFVRRTFTAEPGRVYCSCFLGLDWFLLDLTAFFAISHLDAIHCNLTLFPIPKLPIHAIRFASFRKC